MTKNLEIETPAWEPCPAGELLRSQDRIKSRERRRSFAQLSGVVVCAVILVAIGVQARTISQSQTDESMAGGVSCSEVQQFAGTTGSESTDPETRAMIAAHMAECPHCKAKPSAQFVQFKLHKEAVKAGEIAENKTKPHCD